MPFSKLLTAFAAWLLVCSFAYGQLTTTGAGKKPGGAPAAVAWTGTAASCQVTGFASATVTFTSVAIGTGLVIVGTQNDSSRTVSSVTVNGNAGTVVGTGNAQSAMYRATNTGSSGNIVVVFNAAPDIACISVGYLTGATAAPTATGSLAVGFRAEPIALGSLTIPANGVGVVLSTYQTAEATPFPYAWTNATRSAITEANNAGGSNGAATGMATMTTTANPTSQCAAAVCAFDSSTMMAGAWGP